MRRDNRANVVGVYLTGMKGGSFCGASRNEGGLKKRGRMWIGIALCWKSRKPRIQPYACACPWREATRARLMRTVCWALMSHSARAVTECVCRRGGWRMSACPRFRECARCGVSLLAGFLLTGVRGVAFHWFPCWNPLASGMESTDFRHGNQWLLPRNPLACGDVSRSSLSLRSVFP